MSAKNGPEPQAPIIPWVGAVIYMAGPRSPHGGGTRLGEAWRATFGALNSVPPFRCQLFHGTMRAAAFREYGDVVVVCSPGSELPMLTEALARLDRVGPVGARSALLGDAMREVAHNLPRLAERDASGWLRTPEGLRETSAYVVGRFLERGDLGRCEFGTVHVEDGELRLQSHQKQHVNSGHAALPSQFWALYRGRLVEIGLPEPDLTRPEEAIRIARTSESELEVLSPTARIAPLRLGLTEPLFTTRR